jgi:hypothetical protein
MSHFPVKIIMPILTPTANELNRLRWARNWKAIKQMKHDYFNLLLLCGAHEEIYRARPREKRRVTFCSFRPRLLDSDNLAGGFKYLRDTLESMGLIYRDSPRYLEASYKQETGQPVRTEILIEKL